MSFCCVQSSDLGHCLGLVHLHLHTPPFPSSQSWQRTQASGLVSSLPWGLTVIINQADGFLRLLDYVAASSCVVPMVPLQCMKPTSQS